MHPDAIRALLRRRPFRAFRMFILESTPFDVTHPDLLIVSGTSGILSVPAITAENPQARQTILIALAHVTRIMPISRPSAPGA